MIFAAILASLALVGGLVSCSSSGGGSSSGPLLIDGSAFMTYSSSYSLSGVVIMYENGMTPISDASASVSINGEDLSPSLFCYLGYGLTPVEPGDPVAFSIAYGGTTVNESVTAPGSVTITAPTDGDTFLVTSSIPVTWAASAETPEPSEVRIEISSDYTNDTSGYSQIVPFSMGSWDIPANTFKSDASSAVINVSGVASKAISGSGVMTGSVLSVLNTRSVSITFK